MKSFKNAATAIVLIEEKPCNRGRLGGIFGASREWGTGMRLWVGLGLSILSSLAAATELRDVRVWASPDSTRVVFDLDGTTEHTLFTLSNPDRLVIDLKNTRRSPNFVENAEVKGHVVQVRSGTQDGGTLRVVLDLKKSLKSKSFSLPPNDSYGDRVVVDLFDEGAAAAKPVSPMAPGVPGPDKPVIIAIDAGHGGEDPGARGLNGMWEKDIALSLARRLSALVDQEKGFKSVLIRDGDYYVGLRDRIDKAQVAQADLLVSIHANSFRDSTVRGTAVYVLSPKGASSEHAKLLAQRENMSDLIGGVESQARDDTTRAVLIDIAQTSAIEASHDLGDRMLSAIGRVNPLQKRRVQQAAFVVLKAPDIPSVLIETAFLTNAQEARLLADPGHQAKLARSMFDGIKGYFENYRPQRQYAEAGLQTVSFGRTPAAR